MPAYRQYTCAGPADHAAHQGEVDDHPHIRDTMRMMGDAHRPGEDRALGTGVSIRHALDGGAVDAATTLDRTPVSRFDLAAKVNEAFGCRLDEIVIDLPTSQ